MDNLGVLYCTLSAILYSDSLISLYLKRESVPLYIGIDI